MEQNISILFKNLGVAEDIIHRFENNGITLEILKDLDDSLLKELCPHIATRIVIKKAIDAYITAEAPTETASTETPTEVEVINLSELNDVSFSLSDIMLKTSITIPDFDLKTLLETSPCGKGILQYYMSVGHLDTKRKNRLTDIIIRHLFCHIVNHRLTYDDYNVITGKIITLFPREVPGTYFTRPIRKADSVNGKSVSAKGKLIDKVRNLLFQSGEKKRKQYESVGEGTTKKKCFIETDVILDDVKFLQAQDDIKYMRWDDIVQKWNNTYHYRQDQEYASVHEFILKWPVLEDDRAIELINIDFQFLYPNSAVNENNFNAKWQIFFNKFIELKKHEINDEFKENLLSSLRSLHSEDQQIPTQITLLAHLVPPKGRFNRKGKFSTLEALQSLMVIIENPGDVNIKIKEKQESAAERKQSVQPYIIVQGSLQDFHCLYIVVDDIKYKFTSAGEAFDTLFKIYHVFNARYPLPADHLYLIIQKCVYDITTKYDNLVPYIADVLALK